MDDVEIIVRDFILDKFLPNTTPEELTADTPLIAGGILDSMATVRVVMFLEERFAIEVHAVEATVDNLATLARIGALVRRKQDAGGLAGA
jgi:acyl carrier protein